MKHIIATLSFILILKLAPAAEKPEVSVVFTNQPVQFAPEVLAKLGEKSSELLASCAYKDFQPSKTLEEAATNSYLRVKFNTARRVEIPIEKITLEAQELVITFPLSTGGIWVRTPNGVFYLAKYNCSTSEELRQLLAPAKPNNAS